MKIACLVSRFNEEITEKLLHGALDGLEAGGIRKSQVDVFKVPGAFELPITLQNVLLTRRYDGVVVLSTIVKGGTDHDQYIARALTNEISHLALKFNVPVTYGVITSNTWRQALDRSGGKHGNRGRDAAEACLEMIHTIKRIRNKKS